MAALELSADRIRVNAICPGAVSTRIEESKVRRNGRKAGPAEALTMTRVVPLTYNALGSPAQVAPLVVFLASDESSFISGAEIHVDGAESLFQG
jgi:NAD(P)-dependent dehydrogenase (short-subunit alcohol dehydrogenase family)